LARRRGPRLKKGLPRGGLGLLGFLPALGSVALSLLARADLAVPGCLPAVALTAWCALGLRKDDAAGEVSDFYEDKRSLVFTELLAGNWEHPMRRRSNWMLGAALLGLAIALCRWWFGWEPLG
jgi:hypothetical protein